jgi:hypothetical protein
MFSLAIYIQHPSGYHNIRALGFLSLSICLSPHLPSLPQPPTYAQAPTRLIKNAPTNTNPHAITLFLPLRILQL